MHALSTGGTNVACPSRHCADTMPPAEQRPRHTTATMSQVHPIAPTARQQLAGRAPRTGRVRLKRLGGPAAELEVSGYANCSRGWSPRCWEPTGRRLRKFEVAALPALGSVRAF